MHKEDWDDLRVALAVARAYSFARAARLLNVNESTVVRKVGAAEQRLNARLFDRKQGTITPTAAGRALIERAERIEAVVQDATDAIRDADHRIAGTVRLTSVPLLVNRVLIPLLPELVHRHPDLQVELIADARVLSLARRETDVALRLTRPIDSLRAVARKVGELRYAAYSSSGSAAQTLPWLTYVGDMAMLPQAEWSARQVNSGASLSPIRVSDGESLLACVRAGLGKALLPQSIGDQDSGLQRLETGPVNLSRELWLMVHPDLRKLDRVLAVMDWVVEAFASQPDGQGVSRGLL